MGVFQETQIYIYIDHSASDYPNPTFVSSTTEPSYVEASFGWYNGEDRRIGFALTNSSSTSIMEFITNGDKITYKSAGIQVASNVDTNGWLG